MDDRATKEAAAGGASADVMQPFDPVQELERLRELVWRRRRVVFASSVAFIFLFVLSLMQFLGTLSACRLLLEARRESARVQRETGEYLDEIRAAQELAQLSRGESLRVAERQRLAMPAVPAVPYPDSTGDPRLMKRDMPPDGGLLVGFRVGICQENGSYVASLQPIYLTAQGETLGALLGKEPTLVIHYRAKKRYAVGAVKVRTGQHLELQLTYMRMGTKFLDSGDSYEDEWIGNPDRGDVQVLGGDGSPAVGLLASAAPDGELNGLGLVRVKPTGAAVVQDAVTEPATELDAILEEIRKAIKENRLVP